MDEHNKSLTWVVVAAGIVVAIAGWCMMANSYKSAHAPSIAESAEDDDDGAYTGRVRRRRGARMVFVALREFFGTSVTQLPNLPSVIGWHFSNRLWLIILIGVLEAGVVAVGIGLAQLEKQLEAPKKKRKTRKINTPRL